MDTDNNTDNNTENYPPYFFPAAPSGARDFRRLTPRQRLFRNRLVARRGRRLSTAALWALVFRRILALFLQVLFLAASLAALLLLALS